MQIYWNKRKFFQKKKVQLPQHQHGRRLIVLEREARAQPSPIAKGKLHRMQIWRTFRPARV